jgi:beta-barrel assembly-enhancing protease
MNRLLVLSALAATSGCALISSSMAPVEKGFAQALISDEQELQLGLQVHEELLKDEKVKLVTNNKLNVYVEGLVARLTPTANKERQLDWKVFVIDDPKSVNAFAVPGGRIYVYTGLLMAAKNEAQVVGVLGHELGHVVGRHTARRLVYAYGFNAVAGIALGQNPNQLAEIAAALVGGGTLLAYGREMENEADEFGARYAHYADYDPNQLAEFFRLLSEKSPDLPPVLVYLSSHPSNAERIGHIHAFIHNGGFKGTQVAPERLTPIKLEIERLANAAAGAGQRPAADAPLPAANQPAPASAQKPEEKSTGTPTIKRSPSPSPR